MVSFSRVLGRSTWLISQAQRLSSQNLLLPLRGVVDTFLSTPNLTGHDFNQFLRALADLPYRSAEGMRAVERVLGEMNRRGSAGAGGGHGQAQVDRTTWIRLVLSSASGTGKGEGALRLVRKIHNYLEEPDEGMLRALLRVYAKHGALPDARKCLDSLVALRGHVDSRWTTTLLTAFDNKDDAAAFLESLSPSTSPSIHMHTAALHVAAKDLQTSTHNLIRSFLLISRATPPTTAAPTYTVLIRGLLLRKQYRLASIFFTKLMRSGLPLDNPALAAGLEALTRNGQPHLAFQVLEKYTLGTTTTPVTLTTLTLNQFLVSLNRIGRPDISIRLFTHMQTLYACVPNSQTLSILLQASRLAIKLDASPSTPRLRRLLPFGSSKEGRRKKAPRNKAVDTILSALGHPSRGGLRRYVDGNYMGLDPATFARDMLDIVVNGVVSGAVAGRPDFNIDTSPPPPVAPDEDTRHVSDIGLTILHLSRFRQKLLAGSPSYSTAATAAVGGRASSVYEPEPEDDEDRQYISDIGLTMAHVRRFGFGLKPKINAIDGKEARHRGRETEPEGPDRSPRSSSPSFDYPSIIPTNSNFFNYIFLLCCLPDNPSSLSPRDLTSHSTPPTPHLIPHTFSQMRQLGIQPSNSTLAIGLVGWWDVCLPTSQFASMSSTTSNDQQIETKDKQPMPMSISDPSITPPPHAYIHFVNWLRDWVGESRLPHWRTLEKWRGILERARVARPATEVGDG